MRGGAGTALVGDPHTVAARLKEYADLGVDSFVLSGYPHLEEAYRFAELVFPLLPGKAELRPAGKIVTGGPFDASTWPTPRPNRRPHERHRHALPAGLSARLFGATPGTAAYETARWLNRRVGSRHDEHFTPSLTREGFFAGSPRRRPAPRRGGGPPHPGQHLPNDRIQQIVADDPVLLGVGAVDPIVQGVQPALDELERAVNSLGLIGIDVEPGFGQPARHADDRAYFPVYEACAALNVPVFIMSRPDHARPSYNDRRPSAGWRRLSPLCRLSATTALPQCRRHSGRGLPPRECLCGAGHVFVCGGRARLRRGRQWLFARAIVVWFVLPVPADWPVD